MLQNVTYSKFSYLDSSSLKEYFTQSLKYSRESKFQFLLGCFCVPVALVDSANNVVLNSVLNEAHLGPYWTKSLAFPPVLFEISSKTLYFFQKVAKRLESHAGVRKKMLK
jgi:hypothetical protein